MLSALFYTICTLFYFLSAFLFYRLLKKKEFFLALPHQVHKPSEKTLGFFSLIVVGILFIAANIVAVLLFDYIGAKAHLNLNEEQYFSFVTPLANIITIAFIIAFAKAL